MAGENEGSGSFELPGPVLLAHELRSHLAAITLASSYLARRLGDRDDPHVIKSLKTIDNAARRAMELTAFVLASSAQPPQPVEAARPVRPRTNHHVDVVQVIRDVVEDLSLLVPSRKVRVTAVDDCAGRGDDVRIRAVLTNVILTAARKAANDGGVDIQVERISGDAHVTVATAAWKPSQAELDELLRPFANLDSTISLDAPEGGFDGEPAAASSDVAVENNHRGVLVRVRLTATGGGRRISRQSTSSANESHFRTP